MLVGEISERYTTRGEVFSAKVSPIKLPARLSTVWSNLLCLTQLHGHEPPAATREHITVDPNSSINYL